MGDRLGIPGAVGFCLSLRLRSSGCFASFLLRRRPWRGPLPIPPGPNTLCITCAGGSSLRSGPAAPRRHSSLHFLRAACATPIGLPVRARAGLVPPVTPAFFQPTAAPSAATRERAPGHEAACLRPRAPARLVLTRFLQPLGAFSSQGNSGPSNRRAKPWGLPSASAPGAPRHILGLPSHLGVTGPARPATQASVSAGTHPDPALLQEPGDPRPAVVSPHTRERSWHQPGGRAGRQTENAVCARRAPSSSGTRQESSRPRRHTNRGPPLGRLSLGRVPGLGWEHRGSFEIPKPLGDSPSDGLGVGATPPLASAQRRPDNPPL